jgi:hypothetical protein
VAENSSENAGAELAESVTTAAAITELNELEDRTRRLAKESRAASTWRAYDSDLRHFQTWCAERQLKALPADRSPSPRTSPPSRRHTAPPPSADGWPRSAWPTRSRAGDTTVDAGVRSVLAGIRRRHGTASRKVRATRTKIVTTMVAPLGDRPRRRPRPRDVADRVRRRSAQKRAGGHQRR